MVKTVYIIKADIKQEGERGELYVSENYFGGSFSYIENIRNAREFSDFEIAKKYKNSLETMSTLEELDISFQIIKKVTEYVDAETGEDVIINEPVIGQRRMY